MPSFQESGSEVLLIIIHKLFLIFISEGMERGVGEGEKEGEGRKKGRGGRGRGGY